MIYRKKFKFLIYLISFLIGSIMTQAIYHNSQFRVDAVTPVTKTLNTTVLFTSAVFSTNFYASGAERTASLDGVTYAGKAVTTNPINFPTTGTTASSLIQLQGTGSNGVIYNTTSMPGRITTIQTVQSGTARSHTLYLGNSRLVSSTSADYATSGTSQLAKSTSTSTWTVASGQDFFYFSIKQSSTNTIYFSSISITYDTDVPPSGEVAVSSVAMELASITLNSGQTTQGTATVSPENATNKSVSWTSSSTSIATVNSSSGVVTANSSGAAGTTTIRATSVADATKFAEVVLTVNPVLVTSISVTFGQNSIGIGSTTTATGSVLPANATNKTFTWSSSNDAVATVNAGGTVTGISAGSANIIATASDASGITGSSAITVTSPIGISSLNFTTPEPYEILVGELSSADQYSATLEIDPSNASNLEVTFASSNSSIVEVASSSRANNIWTVKLIGKSMGAATITATADSDGTKIDTLEVVVKLHNESSPTLIISEYIESGNQKAIEITNLTSSSINLTSYSLRLYSNGSTSPTTTAALTGSVAATQSVYFKNSLSTSISDGTINDAVNFNGNDAIALFDGTSNIDVFGVIGVNPGSSWIVTFNSGAGTTEDVTLRRKASVYHATSVWNPLEWDVFAVNTFNGLGSHTLSSSGNATLYSSLFMTLTSNMQGNSSGDNVCAWIGSDKWLILKDQYDFMPNTTKDYFATNPAKIESNDPGDMILRYSYLRNNANSGLTLTNFLVNSSNTPILAASGFINLTIPENTNSIDVLIKVTIAVSLISLAILYFRKKTLKF
jgi:uncharacterized protein YjdB